MSVQMGRAGLLPGIRRLVQSGADERAAWIRENLRRLMVHSDHDAAAINALTGVSSGTVRNFLRGTDSSLSNVLRMSLALGVSLGDLERPPEDFGSLLANRTD